MTNSEFSNQFDVLYNNIMSNQAPGLDEYEKSVFLTKAQDEIVKAYFNPKGNKFIEGFDGSQQRQIDFSMLMATSTISSFDTSEFDGRTDGVKSIVVPADALMFVNETLQVTRDSRSVILTVLPISYQEYSLYMMKPYKRPAHYQAWRILDNTSGSDRKADIVAGPNDALTKYTARYVKRPLPIILVPLSYASGLSLGGYLGRSAEGNLVSSTDGSTVVTSGIECGLDPILHEEILQRSVELAKAAYTGDLSSQLALGVNSETNMGVVPQSSNR